ncbi:hypothetical protein CAPTEDRAFT_136397 [Capitella teleta]|uniref:Amidase domain-containing protein n=1 Tax=Capitella teleta TaxID=283909 RepID=R7UJ03_CAPTE|nr:hypothetical protein CAPTEDRAFT_136397 [Capitella teleta]|eukprot:ELU03267.1 hypothetical protein CAPTEDRAFT_136397 [Capitella teleta]
MVIAFLNPIFRFIYERPSARQKLSPPNSPLLLKSAVELAKMVRSREVSCVDVVSAFVQRSRELNKIVNALVVDCYDEALREAERVDERLSGGKNVTEQEAPLLGVPFTAKEAFAAKGLANTSGLLNRKHVIASTDAVVVARLRAAGAILIGLTNCSELCMWYESNNLIYGRTKNAYHRGRIVGGSSGGEACQISCISVIGVGSDIGGSIRMPAFFNGIFGHKPTTGIVDNTGQHPIAINEALTFLSTGPMCRYSCDLIPMLKVMAGPTDMAKLSVDTKVNIRNLKYYYMEDDGGSYLTAPVDPQIKGAVRSAVSHFGATGCIVRNISCHLMKWSFNIWATKMSMSGNISFCKHMGGEKDEVVSPYEELYYWLTLRARHTLPAIGLGILEKFRDKEENEKRFRDMCDQLRDQLSEILGSEGVFIYPAHPVPAPYHNQPLTMIMNFAYTGIFNVLGFPVTSVPMGLSKEGVPIGIQVVSNFHNDHLALAVACELENKFGGWVKPF